MNILVIGVVSLSKKVNHSQVKRFLFYNYSFFGKNKSQWWSVRNYIQYLQNQIFRRNTDTLRSSDYGRLPFCLGETK